jgi:hypothetical protein
VFPLLPAGIKAHYEPAVTDQIYRDLMAERVSSRAAVAMLQALTKRQKGGWLEKSIAQRGSNGDA